MFKFNSKNWIVIDFFAIILTVIFVQYLLSNIEQQCRSYTKKEFLTFQTQILSPPSPESIELLHRALQTHNKEIINSILKIEGYAGITIKLGSKTIYHKGIGIPPLYSKSQSGITVIPVGRKIWGVHQIVIKPYRILLIFDLQKRIFRLSENLIATEATVQIERPQNAIYIRALPDFNGKIGAFLVFKEKRWYRILFNKLRILNITSYITFSALALLIIYLWHTISRFNRYISTVSIYETEEKPVIKTIAGDALKYKIYRTGMVTALSKKRAKDTIEAICDYIADMLDATFWSVIFLSEKRENWRVFAQSKNFDRSCLERAIKEPAESLTHIDTTVNTKNYMYHTKYIPERYCSATGHSDHIETALDIPILMGKEVVAVFVFYWSHIRKQKKEEEDIISNIQEILTEVIQSAYKIQDIHHKTLKDPLLGIFNRNILDHIKEKIKGCILFIDLDNFKQVNDRFGHDKGDEILKVVVALIKKSLRKEDILLRYGGDEFVVILPGIQKDNCLEITERIRNTLYKNLNDPYGVTASIGVREIKQEESVENAITEADKVMYRAKKFGKNRIISS